MTPRRLGALPTLLAAALPALALTIGLDGAGRQTRGNDASTTTAADAANAAPQKGLTAVGGVTVGHHTLRERPTGCTVILTEGGAVGSVDVRGGAPGTRETDLLDPVNSVSVVHGIVLSGGSAFGLDAATGVMRYLEEKQIGYDTRVAKVPIVPAAILFDLAFSGDPSVRPTADCGYKAAKAASNEPVAEGNVGAGAGATIGKLAGRTRMMKGGLGSAAITLPDGLVVAALVAVNAAGDVIDPATGRVIAGVRTPDGKGLADARVLLRAGGVYQQAQATPRPGENTTIGVVATNAALTKVQAQKIAQMAHDGFARAIAPVHTPSDGDVIFSIATGTWRGRGAAGAPDSSGNTSGTSADMADASARVALIGALAAEAMADAILRAVTQAEGLANVPAARDLGVAPRSR